MKSTFLMLAIAASVAFGPAAWAQSSGWSQERSASPSAASRVIGFSGSLKGKFTTADGKCTVGFSNQCKSSDCTCYTFNGAANVSRAGKGQGTLYATLDFGSGAASGLHGECFPVWAELMVNAAKDTENWHAVGYACNTVDGKATPMQGGLVLGNSDIYNEATAVFTLKANFSKSTFTMNLSGKAEM